MLILKIKNIYYFNIFLIKNYFKKQTLNIELFWLGVSIKRGEEWMMEYFICLALRIRT
jgi:hypothetical protein